MSKVWCLGQPSQCKPSDWLACMDSKVSLTNLYVMMKCLFTDIKPHSIRLYLEILVFFVRGASNLPMAGNGWHCVRCGDFCYCEVPPRIILLSLYTWWDLCFAGWTPIVGFHHASNDTRAWSFVVLSRVIFPMQATITEMHWPRAACAPWHNSRTEIIARRLYRIWFVK